MARPRRKLYRDPEWEKWAVTFLLNLSKEDKSLLNNRELSSIRTKSLIKRFVTKGSDAEHEILFTKLGVEVSRFYYAPKKLDGEIVKKVYRQYTMHGKPVENINEMLRQNIFVIHSKDIATSLAMMSFNSHSAGYNLNYELARTSKAVKTALRVAIDESSIERQYSQAADAFNHLFKIVAALFSADKTFYAEGWEDLDFVILALIAQFPNKYVSRDYVWRMTDHKWSFRKVCARLSFLFLKQGCIDKLPVRDDTPSFTITAKGILVMGEFVNFLLSR